MMQQPAAEAFSAFATFLGTPLPDDPTDALLVLRRDAAAAVEKLLALLDVLDGDPDLEPALGGGYLDPGDDRELDRADEEPSMGWCDTEARHGRYVDTGGADEFDDDQCDREDGGDDEPSLGGGMAELIGGELVNDLEHDTADDELSLGWTDGEAQGSARNSVDPLVFASDGERGHRALPAMVRRLQHRRASGPRMANITIRRDVTHRASVVRIRPAGGDSAA